MKKRIYLSMTLLLTLAILLISVVLCVVFYGQITQQVRTMLRQETQMLADGDREQVRKRLEQIHPEDLRVTLMQADGTVLFDNKVDIRDMKNHFEREEVQEALSYGEGEGSRHSDTLGEKTYYFALRLENGDVLRTAQTVQYIWTIFKGPLPAAVAVILFLLVLSYIMVGRLTKKVVEPMNRLTFQEGERPPYDELGPFFRALSQYRFQLKQSNETLRSRMNTIDSIMENMNEGMLLLNQDGVIMAHNQSAMTIFGLSASMEGHNALELLRDIDFMEAIQAALEGERSEIAFEKGNGLYRMLVSPIPDMGVSVLLLNITERFQGEKMRREFSANVSHELKTPLTSIYGYAEMLDDGVVEEEDKHHVYQKIKGEAARVIDLIEDIMKLSELDEKNGRGDEEVIDLSLLVSDCIESLSQQAEKQGVSVRAEGTGSLRGNRSMIYELFYNLIENAIKYNKPGGHVTVKIMPKEGKLNLSVVDDGIGIPKEEQSRIFERFYRVEKSRSKKSGGTGLGLAIVKHIVLSHNGSIEVISEENKGTEMRSSFPVEQER